MAKYERCDVCMQTIYPKLKYKRYKDSQSEVRRNDKVNPTNIKHYSIYDRKFHLCPLDAKLSHMEGLYMSGYIDKVPMEGLGPIIFSEWRTSSNNNHKITVTTSLGKYQLLEPSISYTSTSNGFYDRAHFSKNLVNFIKSHIESDIDFESLWEKCYQQKMFRLILNNNKMKTVRTSIYCILHEIAKLDTDKEIEFVTQCLKWFFAKDRRVVSSPITSTPIVKKIFEQLFTTLQNDVQTDKKCGICEGCTILDCGECKYCRDMVKFGGAGDGGKDCLHRNCSGLPPEFNDSYEYDTSSTESEDELNNKDYLAAKAGDSEKDVKCVGKPIISEGDRVYYNTVKVNQQFVKIGDFVTVVPKLAHIPDLVVKIRYIWQVKSKQNEVNTFFHGQIFMRACDTVLGSIGDPNEVYLIDACSHGTSVESIRAVISVTERSLKENINPRGKNKTNGNVFYYKMFYNRFYGRFETLPFDPACPNLLMKHRYCPSCTRNAIADKNNMPSLFNKINVSKGNITKVVYGSIKWKGLEYTKGKGVFLNPGTFSHTEDLYHDHSLVRDSTGSTVHDSYRSEFYRRTETEHKGSNEATLAPFCIGCINTIYTTSDGYLVNPLQVFVTVNVMYRPQNTSHLLRFPQKSDLNLVYWSDEVQDVPLVAIVGPCHLYYEKNIPPADEAGRLRWLEDDPRRFYFNESYDKVKKECVPVPENAIRIGYTVDEQPSRNTYKPMKCLDLYAGCGGLSEGLRQSGVADCYWAVDNDVSAAMSYEMNHRGCKVYLEDCNTVLERLVRGEKSSLQGIPYPKKGQVELVCGGPPCQGYSTMNRYNSSDNSISNNSQIVTFLSFCEFYKPKYIIMENVKNFVLYKGGLVLKLSLRALLDMKYQCTFAVLQAGHYGVPQTRKRLILLAAAPGFTLPIFPEPSHVFDQRACNLSLIIDDKRFFYNYGWFSPSLSAPRRTCNIEDAISDLPTLVNASKIDTRHVILPLSYYQKILRNGNTLGPLIDHTYKKVNPLVDKRISLVPIEVGADWRCIPNIVETLSDGSQTAILEYTVDDKKNGKTPDGNLRGVCPCVNGSPCNPASNQKNTLIPWCLVHTANKNNNWAGLYGRVDWCGYFSTTVTDPEPIGKQGRVLHPSEHRILSVRENARSQGIPDNYRLFGTMRDKYRQIGNAVPPPLAAAIGRELRKVIHDN